MRYAYYPGCSLHSTASEYDISTRAISSKLGIELLEVPDWICCGATPAHVTRHLISISLPVKNLLLAKSLKLPLLACCAACFSRLKFANHIMQSDPLHREKVNKLVGAEYQADVPVKHLLEVLIDDLGLEKLTEFVARKLTDLKVACYYGCLLTRPPKVMKFDDPENPSSMDKIISSLGATAVDWPHRSECCGASFAIARTDVVVRLSHDILSEAMRAGADCIAVACPLCQSNLDLRQKEIEKTYHKKIGLPVFYFTQLIGLALGLKPSELGLNRLLINPMPLLKQKELL